MSKMRHFNSFILFGVFLLAYIFLFSFALIFKNVSPLELFNPNRQYFRGVNIIPFHTICGYMSGSLKVPMLVAASNVFGNIILFIPLGIYLQLLKKNKKVLTSMLIVFFTTMFVEMFQFMFGLGTIDVDDIILNFLGGLIGILIYRGLYSLLKNEEKLRAVIVLSGFIIILIPILITIMSGLRLRLI